MRDFWTLASLARKAALSELQREPEFVNDIHYGNNRKKLPDHSTQLATLDIDQPPARGTMNAKSHRIGGFCISEDRPLTPQLLNQPALSSVLTPAAGRIYR